MTTTRDSLSITNRSAELPRRVTDQQVDDEVPDVPGRQLMPHPRQLDEPRAGNRFRERGAMGDRKQRIGTAMQHQSRYSSQGTQRGICRVIIGDQEVIRQACPAWSLVVCTQS